MWKVFKMKIVFEVTWLNCRFSPGWTEHLDAILDVVTDVSKTLLVYTHSITFAKYVSLLCFYIRKFIFQNSQEGNDDENDDGPAEGESAISLLITTCAWMSLKEVAMIYGALICKVSNFSYVFQVCFSLPKWLSSHTVVIGGFFLLIWRWENCFYGGNFASKLNLYYS
jgi:hypothetical protein